MIFHRAAPAAVPVVRRFRRASVEFRDKSDVPRDDHDRWTKGGAGRDEVTLPTEEMHPGDMFRQGDGMVQATGVQSRVNPASGKRLMDVDYVTPAGTKGQVTIKASEKVDVLRPKRGGGPVSINPDDRAWIESFFDMRAAEKFWAASMNEPNAVLDESREAL